MRVVLDTNVLVSGIFWDGAPSFVLERWIEEKYDLVVSPVILDEYRQVLLAMPVGRETAALAGSWTLLLARHATLVQAPAVTRVCRDRDDDKFIDCALAGSANVIVSEDRDLLTLGEVYGIKLLSARTFLEYLGK